MMRRKTFITFQHWVGHKESPYLVFQIPKHGFCEFCGGQGHAPIGTDGVYYYCYYCWYREGAINSEAMEMLDKWRMHEEEMDFKSKVQIKRKKKSSVRI